ncbi:MAG: lipocalin-like domain-containing protein [Actinomycetota bacterium]|nr:lipocalin-like domain-containing protein [Actinomycetota bacterium]
MTRARGKSRYVSAGAILLVIGVTAAFTGTASQAASSTPTPTAAAAPQPIPPSAVVLTLPKDMYLHQGSPTEWWWHTGTLRAGNRTFGFEINAASFEAQGFAFSQIMLTDVSKQRHYQRTTVYAPPGNFSPTTWAQSDVSKPWSARLGDEANKLGGLQLTSAGSGYTAAPTVTFTGDGTGASATAQINSKGAVSGLVLTSAGKGYTTPPKVTITGNGSGAKAVSFPTFVSMAAPAADPTKNMHVRALLTDDPSMTAVTFDLTLSQKGRPFFVWGTGVNPGAKGTSTLDNNYYFSLTHLKAKGSITIDGKKLPVQGVTWMDHEYGAFGTAANPVQWILQDMQLDNGFSISNVGIVGSGQTPTLNTAMVGFATLEAANGDTYLVGSTVTPFGKTWKSPESGDTYFTQFRVQIPSFGADIVVTTLMDSQEFPGANGGGSVYEGVAKAKGIFKGKTVGGTAWIEQTF